ncbi:MAG: nucleoside triphosphate pyrophosphohydrolase [Synergistaceae bacterium]
MNKEETQMKFIKLLEVMDRLRGKGGCPWDAEQTMTSLKRYIIEEAYELVEAITKQDKDEICEECGDLLLQVIFVSTIAKENGLFEVGDVISIITEKMIRRHPHVFGDINVKDSDEVLKNWEQIKRQEKKERMKDESVIAGIPQSLPSILRAQRIQERAAKVGFDWPKEDLVDVFEKVQEEIGELKEAMEGTSRENMIEELGDSLFVLVNLARHLNIDPESALQESSNKFSDRFRIVEKEMNKTSRAFDSFSIEELNEFWNFAKNEIYNRDKLVK